MNEMTKAATILTLPATSATLLCKYFLIAQPPKWLTINPVMMATRIPTDVTLKKLSLLRMFLLSSLISTMAAHMFFRYSSQSFLSVSVVIGFLSLPCYRLPGFICRPRFYSVLFSIFKILIFSFLAYLMDYF